jgi:hypothetical protein
MCQCQENREVRLCGFSNPETAGTLEGYMLWSVLRLNADSLEEATKFLVLWHFDLTRLGAEVTRAVIQMPEYAKKLGDKLECRYHVIGSHGAWIYKVTSNEELDRASGHVACVQLCHLPSSGAGRDGRPDDDHGEGELVAFS